ncbi:hypothetical protein LTS18_010889, partial [Coniosporium uncinatum]
MSLRDRLIGTWSLLSVYIHPLSDPTQRTDILGDSPEGMLIYTPEGYMSAWHTKSHAAPYDAQADGQAQAYMNKLGYAG